MQIAEKVFQNTLMHTLTLKDLYTYTPPFVIDPFILSKNVKIVVNTPPVEISEEDEFISAELFDSVFDDAMETICDDDCSVIENDFHDFESDKAEARNYVAGYICKK